jgi:hypothetical protein
LRLYRAARFTSPFPKGLGVIVRALLARSRVSTNSTSSESSMSGDNDRMGTLFALSISRMLTTSESIMITWMPVLMPPRSRLEGVLDA